MKANRKPQYGSQTKMMSSGNNPNFENHNCNNPFIGIISLQKEDVNSLLFLFCPAGLAEADIHRRQSARHPQQRAVHGAHHLHQHAGEQRTLVSHHQLPGTRLDRRQRRRQRHRPQDRRDIGRGHATAQRLHFHARYAGDLALGSRPPGPELGYCPLCFGFLHLILWPSLFCYLAD